MRTLFFLGSIAGVACGARHFVNYLSQHRKARAPAKAPRKRLRRTAQNISPRPPSRVSPRSVG